MSKKGRYRKKGTVKERADGEPAPVPNLSEEVKEQQDEEPEVACRPEASKEDLSAQLSMKKIILIGFAILGAIVGFLVGYENLSLFDGIMDSIIGLIFGAALGYVPFISVKQ